MACVCNFMTFSTNILPLNLYTAIYTWCTPNFHKRTKEETENEKQNVRSKISFKIHCQTIHYSFYFEYIFTLDFVRCCRRYSAHSLSLLPGLFPMQTRSHLLQESSNFSDTSISLVATLRKYKYKFEM